VVARKEVEKMPPHPTPPQPNPTQPAAVLVADHLQTCPARAPQIDKIFWETKQAA
jgi:hypothetical protein